MHPQPNPLHELAGSIAFVLLLAALILLMLAM